MPLFWVRHTPISATFRLLDCIQILFFYIILTYNCCYLHYSGTNAALFILNSFSISIISCPSWIRDWIWLGWLIGASTYLGPNHGIPPPLRAHYLTSTCSVAMMKFPGSIKKLAMLVWPCIQRGGRGQISRRTLTPQMHIFLWSALIIPPSHSDNKLICNFTFVSSKWNQFVTSKCLYCISHIWIHLCKTLENVTYSGR